MLTLFFVISMTYVFGKLFILGLRAAWGLTKLISVCVFLPIILIALIVMGIKYLVVPALVIACIVMIVKSIRNYQNA